MSVTVVIVMNKSSAAENPTTLEVNNCRSGRISECEYGSC